MTLRSTKHIKQDSLKKIVENDDKGCDEKLDEIRELLGIPKKLDNEENLQKDDEITTTNSVPEDNDPKEESRIKILEGLTGKDLKLAKNLLIEIEKVPNIDWDPLTLELSVNSVIIPHSSIRLMIVKTVKNNTYPTLPYAFVNWVQALVTAKIPLQYFRDADSLNFRQALILIAERSTTAASESTTPPEEFENRKRAREEDEDDDNIEDTESPKRKKLSEGAETSLNLGEAVPLTEKRRSNRLRLKKSLKDSWKSIE